MDRLAATCGDADDAFSRADRLQAIEVEIARLETKWNDVQGGIDAACAQPDTLPADLGRRVIEGDRLLMMIRQLEAARMRLLGVAAPGT